jgi:hypothetical protein
MMPRADEEKPVREEHDDVPDKEKLIAVEKPDSDDDEIETYYSAEEEPEPEDEEHFKESETENFIWDLMP